ncbi:MAG: peptide deformylase [Candidatus Omnitrophica bacterium]|nr:peptide deformylase [Candidatus Omnitrophota bacterium]
MTVLKVCVYPDPTLREKSIPVTEFDDRLREFIADLADTMKSQPGGIGIAAPQVGNLIRVICVDVTPREKAHGSLVLVNPTISEGRGKRITREGCMSVPEYTANVRRYDSITVEALDGSGERVEFVSMGIESVCIQHEIDHLDGILFLDRVDSLKTDVFRRKRFRESGGEDYGT